MTVGAGLLVETRVRYDSSSKVLPLVVLKRERAVISQACWLLMEYICSCDSLHGIVSYAIVQIQYLPSKL